MKLKAMTYNIQSGKNIARVQNIEFAAEVIRDIAPDFVTVNEVRSHTSDIGSIDQANELGRLAGYYPVFGKSIDVMGGDYGNALLTRLPLVSSEVIHIPDPERIGEGFWEHRSILKSVLKAGDKLITVLCTHFGLLPAEQKNAVDTVLDVLKSCTTPVMLMGDLNLTPDSAILAPIFAALRDTASGALEPKTYPSNVPEMKIDYIFHSAEIRAESLCCPDTQNSDHRPLVAVIEI